ncbi:MAG: hypothetical protein AABY15_01620 [Nanoarchaeota archaeon]
MDSATNEVSSVSFNLVGYKVNHYDRKDLISLKMKTSTKEYDLSFLVDDYNTILFPEFKVLDKYGKVYFRIIHDFLISVRTKVNYFIKLRSYTMSKNKKVNDWDPEKEWWQKEQEEKEIDNDLKRWIDKNIEYLTDYSFDELKDENLFKDFISFFEGKNSGIKPVFEFKVDGVVETMDLKKQLDKAISDENYELAVIIREKIKLKNNKDA